MRWGPRVERAVSDDVLDLLDAGDVLDETLAELAEESRRGFGADAVVQFQIFDRRSLDVRGWWYSRRVRADMAADYGRNHLARDPRVPVALAHPGRVMRCFEMVDERGFERTALVNDFLDRPENDVRWCMASVDPVGADALLLTAFLRPRREGRHDDGDVRSAEALMPHLRSRIGLHLSVARLEAKLVEMADAFDAAREAMIVVDRTLRVQAANAAALALLEGDPRLTVAQGALRAEGPAHRELQAAVQAAVGLREGLAVAEPAPVVLRAARPEDVISISAHPLPRAAGRGGPGRKGEAVLTLRRMERTGGRAAAALRRLGLTASEAAVAELLAKGLSPAEAAEARGVALETVRTQIKSAMAKTGANRQSVLARLVLALG